MSIVSARMIVLKKNATTPCARQARRIDLDVAFTSAAAGNLRGDAAADARLYDMYTMKLSLVTDHFQYPGLIGVIALIVGLATYGLQKSGAHLDKLAPFAAAALVGILGLHTWQQASIYESSYTLWIDTLDKNKGSWTAYNNLAAWHLGRATPDDAAIAFGYAQAAADLGLPDNANPYLNMGRALLLLGEPEKAIEPLRKAIAIWPKFVQAHGNLADALHRTGHPAEALAEYRTALELEPENAAIRYNFAAALVEQNHLDEAAKEYATLLDANPNFAAAHNNFARLLASEGKIGEAVAHYRQALAGLPESARHSTISRGSRRASRTTVSATAPRRWRWRSTRTRSLQPIRISRRSVDARRAGQGARHAGGHVHAGNGRFDDAVRYAQRATDLASAAGQKARAEQIAKRIELYKAHKPVRQGPGIPRGISTECGVRSVESRSGRTGFAGIIARGSALVWAKPDPFSIPHSALRTPHSALRTPHSALRTPHSALCTLHSALCTPHSALRTLS